MTVTVRLEVTTSDTPFGDVDRRGVGNASWAVDHWLPSVPDHRLPARVIDERTDAVVAERTSA